MIYPTTTEEHNQRTAYLRRSKSSKGHLREVCQKSAFTLKINAIKQTSRNNPKNQLGLQLDEHWALRCHDRLISENLPEHTVFPNLLARNHIFTSLHVVINSFHEKLMHAGVSHSFAATRKDFWIPQRRSSVRGVLLSCLRCRQYQRGPYRMPAMSPYPRSRIEESRSFHIQGSKIVKTSLCKASQPSATQKVWLHLFTCLTLRAIHLEVPVMPKKIHCHRWKTETDSFQQCFPVQSS